MYIYKIIYVYKNKWIMILSKIQNSTAAAVEFRILNFAINLKMVSRKIQNSTAAAVDF